MFPWLDFLLILTGIVILLSAIVRHIRLPVCGDVQGCRCFWMAELILMVFFVLAYSAILIFILSGHFDWLLKATTLLLLFGAVFVCVTVRLATRMVARLSEYSQSLEQEVASRTQELVESLRWANASFDELKRTQIELVKSEKLATLGSVAEGLAHEINNPLGYIHANLQVLGNFLKISTTEDHGCERKDESKEIIKDCLEGTTQIADLVAAFGQLSNAPVGQYVEVVRLDNLVQDTIAGMMISRVAESEIQLELEPIQAEVANMADLQTAISNLLVILRDESRKNSVGQDWMARVRVFSQDGKPTVEIHDRAYSPDEQNTLRFFDPNIREDPDKQSMHFDLRAAIAQQLLQRNRASLNIEGDGNGGSLWSISLASSASC